MQRTQPHPVLTVLGLLLCPQAECLSRKLGGLRKSTILTIWLLYRKSWPALSDDHLWLCRTLYWNLWLSIMLKYSLFWHIKALHSHNLFPRYKVRNACKKVKLKVAQWCLTLCDPMDYTVHGILQARILEWVAFPFSRRSSQPWDRRQVSLIAGGFFTSWVTGEAQCLYSFNYFFLNIHLSKMRKEVLILFDSACYRPDTWHDVPFHSLNPKRQLLLSSQITRAYTELNCNWLHDLATGFMTHSAFLQSFLYAYCRTQ